MLVTLRTDGTRGIVERNAAATCTEDAGKRRLLQPLGPGSSRAPGGRQRRPEAASPGGRCPSVHCRRARPTSPRPAPASCGPAHSACPGHLPRAKVYLWPSRCTRTRSLHTPRARSSPAWKQAPPRAAVAAACGLLSLSHGQVTQRGAAAAAAAAAARGLHPPWKGPRPPNSRRLRLARAGGSSFPPLPLVELPRQSRCSSALPKHRSPTGRRRDPGRARDRGPPLSLNR